MLAIQLGPDIEKRLEALAEKTAESETFHARQAILEYLQDLEDGYEALERLKNPGRFYTAEETKRELGL
jgi:RHH-type rel operon transcriptional repressor/antitoxin RelB